MSNHFGVAAKAIIKNKDDKYLILYKSDTEDINPNEVDIPGGRIEFGERVEDGLRREVKEELGIDINIKKPSRVWGFVKNDLHLIGITFMAEYIGGEFNLSGEHDKYIWIDKESVLSEDFPNWIKEEFRLGAL